MKESPEAWRDGDEGVDATLEVVGDDAMRDYSEQKTQVIWISGSFGLYLSDASSE